MEQVVVVGTGLIGTSLALALRRAGFSGRLVGVEKSDTERDAAKQCGAFDELVGLQPGSWESAMQAADVIVLAVPVLAILHWMELLSSLLRAGQLVTDVGSTKERIAEAARGLFSDAAGGTFLPGHPMAGKESGGAALASGELFDGAVWLFTPVIDEAEASAEWRGWISRIGSEVLDLDPKTHDEICAWTSHLPQMVATALASLLEERFGADLTVQLIGGRAIREMTRLGASPYSMWRDVAMTNAVPLGAALQQMEQQLTHLRESLQTPELRELFRSANSFRLPRRTV